MVPGFASPTAKAMGHPTHQLSCVGPVGRLVSGCRDTGYRGLGRQGAHQAKAGPIIGRRTIGRELRQSTVELPREPVAHGRAAESVVIVALFLKRQGRRRESNP